MNTLLAARAAADFKTPGFEHWLQAYSEAELKEVLDAQEGWNSYDLGIARILYHQKTGSAYVPRSAADTGYRPERMETKWLSIGYLLCLLTICGVFFGLAITESKKALSNGRFVPIYDEQTHRHGRRMIMIGIAVTVLFLLLTFR